MTKEQLAEALDGVQYREEDEVIKSLNLGKTDLVIVYGASDDLAEIEGALSDEFGAFHKGNIFSLFWDYEAKAIRFVENLYELIDEESMVIHRLFSRLGRKMVRVNNFVDPDEDYLFKFEPENIPFAPFKVMDEGELYCIGCVFSLEDVKKELGIGNE